MNSIVQPNIYILYIYNNNVYECICIKYSIVGKGFSLSQRGDRIQGGIWGKGRLDIGKIVRIKNSKSKVFRFTKTN